LAVDVLVVGAGPAGLALALQAVEHGAEVRVVERRPELFRPSRAMIMHPRTLEVLRPLGVTDALLARAKPPHIQLHLGSREIPVHLERYALTGTAFPHPVLLRQSDVEAVLSEALAERGVVVERGVELIDLGGNLNHPEAILRTGRDRSSVSCGYLVGCDGRGSTVRTRLGIAWQGAPYRQEVLLADIDLARPTAPDAAQVVAGRDGLVFLFPLGERASWRMLATQAARHPDLPAGESRPGPSGAELQGLLNRAGLPTDITHVAWSDRITLQHRIAASLRKGAVFLVGEAAHAHSPAGGQGMNTSIQDALNLGWKLAFLSGSTPRDDSESPLPASYEQERRPVGRRVLAMTHLLFWGEASTSLLPTFLRGVVAPAAAPLVPLLLRRRRLLSAAFWLLAQFWVQYRSSPLSVDRAPHLPGPRPGQRLPDQQVTCGYQRTHLHTLLAEPGLQVLLSRDTAAPDKSTWGPYVHVHRLSSWPGTGIMIVRPDGYIGYRAATVDPSDITAWLTRARGVGCGGPSF
jgi:2-polyprenyl-6-methoxyphenol hydroxylase-like FAD-dependent oxidoreductase